jgi:ABC-type uncharacterized transport system ATPase subunit
MSGGAMALESTPLLQVQELSLRFGGITALRGVNLTVRRGELVALLGANGAGKTPPCGRSPGWKPPAPAASSGRGPTWRG